MQVRSRVSRLVVGAAAVAALAAAPPAAPPARAQSAGDAPAAALADLVSGDRIDGGGQADPVGQAIATARLRFGDGEAQRVVLVTADRFPDALGGSALAGDQGAVLFTSGPGLDPRTAAEITRLTAGRGGLVVLGGEAAVPAGAAAAALAAAGGGACAAPLPASCRIAGQERIETAALAAAVVRAEHPGAPDLAVVARADDVADALTGGAFAAAAGVPLVLTARDVASQPTREFLASSQVGEVVALGGTAAIADEVLTELAGAARQGRVAGPERTATSAAIARELWPRLGAASGTAMLVNVRDADGWQTALAAAPLAAALRAPQLGVDGPPAGLGVEVAGALAGLERVVVAGDEALVDPGQRLAALNAVDREVVAAPRSRDPFPRGSRLHPTENNATRQVTEWRTSRPADATLMARIADQPIATWMGDWNRNPSVRVATERITVAAAAKGEVPVLVAYNIPARDCGHYSAGGEDSPDGYRRWITELAAGIGSRPAAVILEPDALGLLACLSPADQQVRLDLLADAVRILGAGAKTSVYLDIGTWLTPEEAAGRLRAAGVDGARGFSLNIAGFQWTSTMTTYGESVSRALGGAVPTTFVIDTARSGNGPYPAADDPTGQPWCNPPGRALGSRPRTDHTHPLVDALLWIKFPGQSDGTCRGGPSAGTWWPEYALGLARRAPW